MAANREAQEEVADDQDLEEETGEAAQAIEPGGGRGQAVSPNQEQNWGREYKKQQNALRKAAQGPNLDQGRSRLPQGEKTAAGQAYKKAAGEDRMRQARLADQDRIRQAGMAEEDRMRQSPRDVKKQLEAEKKSARDREREEKIKKDLTSVAEKKGEQDRMGGLMSALIGGKKMEEAGEKELINIAFGALGSFSPAGVAAFLALNAVAIYHLQGGKRFKFDLKQTIILAFVDVIVGALLIVLLTVLLWIIDIISGRKLVDLFKIVWNAIFKSGPSFL